MSTTTNNVIPGASAVGMGFNALQTYSIGSLTTNIFVQTFNNSTTYTDPNSGIIYSVPDNINFYNTSKGIGSAQVFQDISSFQESLSEEAQIAVTYGAFSGQASEAYNSISNEQNSSYYGLYSESWNSWNIGLGSTGSAGINSNITGSQLYVNMPSSFDPTNQENVQAFFQFFDTYGTHYVDQVAVGGRLDYYLTIDQSYSSDMQTLQANVELEYNAVFVDASAQASVDWGTLSQNWASSRQSQLSVTGGDDQILVVTSPDYGTNCSDVFTQWLNGVNKNPAITTFILGNISDLWQGDTAVAVDQAVAFYLNQVVMSTAIINCVGQEVNSMSIYVAGNTIVPNPPVTAVQDTNVPNAEDTNDSNNYLNDSFINAGWQIAVFDSTLQTQKFCNSYYLGAFADGPTMYKQIMTDLGAITFDANDYLITSSTIPSGEFPTAAFPGILV